MADGPVDYSGSGLLSSGDRKGNLLNYGTQSIRNIPKQMKGKMVKLRQSIVMRSPQQLLQPTLFHSGDTVLVRALLRFSFIYA